MEHGGIASYWKINNLDFLKDSINQLMVRPLVF